MNVIQSSIKKRHLWKSVCPAVLVMIMLTLTLALAVPAAAATTVVAEFTAVSGLWERITSDQYAQIFTTGPSDTHANTVQLMLSVWQGAEINVSITETTSGLPDESAVLASGTAYCGWGNALGWFPVTLGAGTSLAANTKYALVVTGTSAAGWADWNGNYIADYSGGTAYVYSDSQWSLLPIWSTDRAALGFKVLDITSDTYALAVTTNPAGITEATGSGSYAAGAAVSISVPENVDITAGESRYHFTHWSGDGVTFANASLPSTTITMPAGNTTVTANYVTQYYLTVDNGGHGTAGGEGWCDTGSRAQAVVSPRFVIEGNTAYSFVNWSGDAGGSDPASNSITMDGPKTATANWLTFYLVTFRQSGLDATAGTWGTIYLAGGTSTHTFDGKTSYMTSWERSGSQVSFIYNQTVTSSTPGNQFALTSPPYQTSPLTVTGPMTISGSYTRQYYLTVDNGGHGTAGGEGWYDAGSQAQATITPLTIDDSSDMRYAFAGWSGDAGGSGSPSNNILMNGPKAATAAWAAQYKITFGQSGIATDALGTVVTVDGVDITAAQLPFTGWITSDTPLTYAYSSPVRASSLKQYTWVSTSGLSQTLQSGTFNVTESGTITGVYNTQCKVAFAPMGMGPDAVGTVLTLNDTTTWTRADFPVYTDWITSGTPLKYAYSSLVNGPTGTNYVWAATFMGASQVPQSDTFIVTEPCQVLARYWKQTVSVSPSSQQYSDPVTFTATLDARFYTGGTPPTSVDFYINDQNMGTGTATVEDYVTTWTLSVPLLETIPGTMAAGSKTVTARFNGIDSPNNPTTTLTITPKDTTLAVVSSNTLESGSVTVKAALLACGTSPISGRTINFTAGDAAAVGITDSAGIASATLSLPPGQYTLTASFAGDSYYQPGYAASQTLFLYQPTGFVIWGGNTEGVTEGQDYVFWGDQWAGQVKAGDFQANYSFKGYAGEVDSSNKTWTARPGNSSKPPVALSDYISVIVSTHIVKNGSTISGDIYQIVILKVDNPASYKPVPNSTGSGVMVAVVQ